MRLVAVLAIVGLVVAFCVLIGAVWYFAATRLDRPGMAGDSDGKEVLR